MQTSIPDSLRLARKVSTPGIAISTADQFATIAAIVKSFEGQRVPPMIQWDCARGFLPCTPESKPALAAMMPSDTYPGVTPGLNLVEALGMAAKLPTRSILFLLNAHRFFNEPAVVQGILNLRDPFKGDQRTLVLLGAIIQLPVELQQDIMTFDEPLPNEDAIRAIVEQEVKNAREVVKDLPEPSALDLRHAVEALAGLASFPAEQATAMSIGAARRLDVDQLWDRKRAFVAQTRGLKFDTTRETYADVGGLLAAKDHGASLFAGKMPPRAIIRIDEIEKHMAGSAVGGLGDSSGTSADQLGVILREMEDNQWRGVVCVGPPGGGKSIFSKTTGRTNGVPTLELDLGALKGSLVGQSEENIRTVMKVIKAIAGSGAYFVATCNKLDVLPPELRRRFVHGIWFFDLPTVEELAPIWTINLAAYGLVEELSTCLELSPNWTGAEVRNVCRLASETGRTIAQAATRIVPVSVSDPDGIERLRRSAAGKFLSASYPGPYQHPGDVVPGAAPTRRFLES